MIRRLDVYLRRQLAGQLIQDERGQMKFSYAESWLNDSTATPLSHSLPLKKGPFSRNQCRGFFAGVLPESKPRARRGLIQRDPDTSPAWCMPKP